MAEGEAAPSLLEEKLNTVSSKLAELEDLQLVNKLDIINLKNEIEKLRLTVSVPSPEALERINELGRIVENVEVFKKLKKLAENIDRVMANAQAPEGLEDIIGVVDDIDNRLKKLETQGRGMKPGGGKNGAASGVPGLSRQLEKLRLMAEENSRNIWRLRTGRREKPMGMKPKPAAGPGGPVVCPRCGARLPPHARFCRKCGAGVQKAYP